jgi:polysaccharide biosynthesis/export protein
MKLLRRFVCAVLCFSSISYAENKLDEYRYVINPGDVLSIYVWKELDVSKDQLLVRPDGRVSLPIIGEVKLAGKTIEQAEEEIEGKLLSYMLDKPNVTVSSLSLNGNSVFVLGKVARPGQFTLFNQLDVTQVLTLAGGVTTFADLDDIRILRRDSSGQQQSIKFDYLDVEKGRNLDTNILIKSGDVVIVP